MKGASVTAELVGEVVATISALSDALRHVDEDDLARFFDRLAADLIHASGPEEIREAVQRGLSIYRGMASFNDLVLMDGTRPDVEGNRRIDELRSAVYDGLTRLRPGSEPAQATREGR